ncbi:hypothetical protein Dd703_1328 [Musicola paradisiaca Ech703]|uniref:Uncharacterized protein n=1 Tax=Musicola paradisiaca (strain Ech703) TaxID=579405 RepID=C6CDL3_MUSP7|nr:hypothetical protein Dd703_1328 [Musicola paradisiaca Ech703]
MRNAVGLGGKSLGIRHPVNPGAGRKPLDWRSVSFGVLWFLDLLTGDCGGVDVMMSLYWLWFAIIRTTGLWHRWCVMWSTLKLHKDTAR